MAGRYRPRREFKFWLFMDKHEESRLVEFIDYCKRKRSFARVVRDGIRLIWSLGEGNTDVLFELFPGLSAKLIPVDALPPPPDTDRLERELADIKKLIIEQGVIPPPPKEYPQMKSTNTIGGDKKILLPVFDDEDDDTLVLNKAAGSLYGGNLLSGILGLEH